MNFNSTDEDEPTHPMLMDDNNEDYMETCDDEINDIVPRLQRLHVNDEPRELRSEILNKPCSTAETIPSLTSIDEEISMANSNLKVSSAILKDMPGKISINEGTKVAEDKEKSLSPSNKCAHTIPANIQDGNQSQAFVKKTSSGLSIHMHPVNQNDEQKLHESEEMKESGEEDILDKSQLNVSLEQRSDHNCAAGTSYTMQENRSEPLSVKIVEKKTKHVDPETGELNNTSGIILPERQSNDRIDDKSKRDAVEYDIIPCSHEMSFSADMSTEDQSNINRGKINYSMPGSHVSDVISTAIVETKRQRKIAVFANPASQIRQRRFNIFNRSSDISENETLRANSISDDESKNSGAIEKDSPKNSRRRCRKIKSPSTPRFPISPDVKNEEVKQPSPCKRKLISTENLAEKTGKFRKRCASECNSETQSVIGTTQSVIRSRSLSLGLKETKPSMEISSIRKSRKRTSSDFQNADRFKSRRSSSSSDDAENK